MSSRNEVDKQRIGEERGVGVIGKEYMVGFVDGFNAASAGGSMMVFPARSLPASDEVIGQVVPPLPQYPTPARPELNSLVSNVFTPNDVGYRHSSHQQSNSRFIDNELPQPIAPPNRVDSNVSEYASWNGSLPSRSPKNWESFPSSDEVVDSSQSEPPSRPRNLQSVPHSHVAVVPPAGTTLKRSEISESDQDESAKALPYRFATKEDQFRNELDVYAPPTVGTSVVVQSLDLLGPTKTPDDLNRNEERIIYRWSSTATTQQSHLAGTSPTVARKRVAPSPTQAVFRAWGTKRSRFNEKSRASTARTRERGACETCRKKKLRCDQAKEDFAPCARCAGTPMHLLHRPCCRVEVIGIKLFRLGTALDKPATHQSQMQSKELRKGVLIRQNGPTAFEPPRRVRLTHDVCRTTTFEVTLSRYEPDVDDTTGYYWTDSTGRKQGYELPPYYISNEDEAAQNLVQYIKKARVEFTRALLPNSNPIIQKTFEEAGRYHAASKSSLVAGALMFWSATRMIERFWLITGDDLLGHPPMKQSIGPCRFNPHIEAVPVTPIMDTQLDEISIKYVLLPLKRKLLGLLKAKVLEKRKQNWYEIFLTSFILLHSSEVVLGQVMDYSRRYGISFAPRSNGESSLSHAYYHACKTILAYYHFASGSAAPLSLDWNDPNMDTSIMSQEQIGFLRDLIQEIKRQNTKLENLKNESMYETEMFWCHQLLFMDWKADMPYKGQFLACTEKDFLLS